MTKKLCTIIIPVLNEGKYIASLLDILEPLHETTEIFFVDGGSQDETIQIIENRGMNCLVSPQKGRAIQMNVAAQYASADYLLFIHADVKWNFNLVEVIQSLISEDIQLANFKLQFDHPHWFLRSNAFFSRYTATAFQFGDQGLWISKQLFETLEGFDERFLLLEDNDIVKRAKRLVPHQKIQHTLIVSSRKYLQYGLYKLQFYYYYLYLLYRIGIPIEKLNRSKINEK